MSAPKFYTVLFWDEQGLTIPMGRNPECDGAIEIIGPNDSIALFTSRKAARKSIDISAKLAALHRSQGKPVNTDFLEGRKLLKIVPCSEISP